MSKSPRDIGSLLHIISDFNHRIREHKGKIDEFDFKLGKIQLIKGFYTCEDEKNVAIETCKGDLEYENIFFITEELMEYFTTKGLKKELSIMKNYRPYMIICCGMVCFIFKHLKTSNAKIAQQLFEGVLNKFLEFFFEIGVFNASELRKRNMFVGVELLTLNCCLTALKKLLKDSEFTLFKKRAVMLVAILQAGVTLRNEENSEEILDIILECIKEEVLALKLQSGLKSRTPNSANSSCILALNSLAAADPDWLLEKEGLVVNLLVLLELEKNPAQVVGVLRCLVELAGKDEKSILLNENIMKTLTSLLVQKNYSNSREVQPREVQLVVLISCCEIVAALEGEGEGEGKREKGVPNTLEYLNSGLLKELITQAVALVAEKKPPSGKVNDSTLLRILQSKSSQEFLRTSQPSLPSSSSSSYDESVDGEGEGEGGTSSSSSFLAATTFSIQSPSPPPHHSLTTPSSPVPSPPSSPHTRDIADWLFLHQHLLALLAPLVTKVLDTAFYRALEESTEGKGFPTGKKAKKIFEDVLEANVLSLLEAYQNSEATERYAIIHSTTEFLFTYLRCFQLIPFAAYFLFLKDAHMKKPEDLNRVDELKFIHSEVDRCCGHPTNTTLPALCALLTSEQFSTGYPGAGSYPPPPTRPDDPGPIGAWNLKQRNDLLLLITLITFNTNIGTLGDVYWQSVDKLFNGDGDNNNYEVDVMLAERMLLGFFFCCAYSQSNINTLCGKKFFFPAVIRFLGKSYGSVWVVLMLFLNLLTFYEKGITLKGLDMYGTGNEFISNIGNVLHPNQSIHHSCAFHGLSLADMHRTLLTSTIHVLTSTIHSASKLLRASILSSISALYRRYVVQAAENVGLVLGSGGGGGNDTDSDTGSSSGSVLDVELLPNDDIQLQLIVVPLVEAGIKAGINDFAFILERNIPQMLVGFFLRVPPPETLPPEEYAKRRRNYAKALRLTYAHAAYFAAKSEGDGEGEGLRETYAKYMQRHDHLRLLYLVLVCLLPSLSSPEPSFQDPDAAPVPTFALVLEAICYAHAILPASDSGESSGGGDDHFQDVLDYVVNLVNGPINTNVFQEKGRETLLRAVTHAVVGLEPGEGVVENESGEEEGGEVNSLDLLLGQTQEETKKDMTLAWKGGAHGVSSGSSSSSSSDRSSTVNTGNLACVINHKQFVQTLLTLVQKGQFVAIILPFLQKLVAGMNAEVRNIYLPSLLVVLKSFLRFDQSGENVFRNPDSAGLELYLLAMRMLWILTRTSPALIREAELTVPESSSASSLSTSSPPSSPPPTTFPSFPSTNETRYNQTFSAHLLHYLEEYIAQIELKKAPLRTEYVILMRYAIDILCRIAADGYPPPSSASKVAATSPPPPSSSTTTSPSPFPTSPEATYAMLVALNLPFIFQAIFAQGIGFQHLELLEVAHVLKLISISGANEVDPHTKKKNVSSPNPYFSKFKNNMDVIKLVAIAMPKCRLGNITNITESNVIQDYERILLAPFNVLLPHLKKKETDGEDEEEEGNSVPLHFNSVQGNTEDLIFTEIYEDLLIAYFCMTKGKEKDNAGNKLLNDVNLNNSPFAEHFPFFQRKLLSKYNKVL